MEGSLFLNLSLDLCLDMILPNLERLMEIQGVLDPRRNPCHWSRKRRLQLFSLDDDGSNARCQNRGQLSIKGCLHWKKGKEAGTEEKETSF